MKLQEAISSIQTALDQMVNTARALSDDVMNWKPAEDKWSVREVLCHVEEAIPFWLDELSKSVSSPGREWGRGIQDKARVAAVERANERNVEEVIAAIEGIRSNAGEVLGSLRDEQLAIEAPSKNPRFGMKPLVFMLDHLLAEHVDVHLRQIRRNIQQYEEIET